MAIVEGTAYWASITRPNEKFEPMWRVDVALSDKEKEDIKNTINKKIEEVLKKEEEIIVDKEE